MERVSTTSTGPIYVPITGTEGGIVRDPTQATVAILFQHPDANDPDDSSPWRAAEWTGDPPNTEAVCVVGPDGTGSETAGVKRPWAQIIDANGTAIQPSDGLIEFV